MASIEFDELSGRYRIRFRYGGQPYKRSLKTRNVKEAQGILGRVEGNVPENTAIHLALRDGGEKTATAAQGEVLSLPWRGKLPLAAVPEGDYQLTAEIVVGKHHIALNPHTLSVAADTVSRLQSLEDGLGLPWFREFGQGWSWVVPLSSSGGSNMADPKLAGQRPVKLVLEAPGSDGGAPAAS